MNNTDTYGLKAKTGASNAEQPKTKIPLGLCQCGCGRKTKICKRSRLSKGWVKGQPYRYIFGHRPTATGNKATIPVAPFRERFLYLNEKEDLSMSEFGRRLDIEEAAAARLLGLRPYRSEGKSYVIENVRYKTAVRLADALHMWYTDLGI